MRDDALPLAVLDANVLFPPSLRDILLCAAELGLFRPFWSGEIMEELRRNLVAKGGVSPSGAERLIRIMGNAFPDALIPVDPERIATFTNDPKDRHVLAVAVEAGASVIVTQNVSDFPAAALDPHGVEAWTADEFLSDLLRERPEETMIAVAYNTAQLRRPPMTPAQLLDRLALHAPEFSHTAREKIAPA